jgi:hypothetical protein
LISLEGAGHNNVECDYMASLLTALQAFFVHLESRRREEEERQERSGKDKKGHTDADTDDSSSDDNEDEPEQ